MKKCKFCQTEIDDKAKICPNCKKKQNISTVEILFISVGLLIGLSVIVNISNNTNTADINNATNNGPAIETNSKNETEFEKVVIPEKVVVEEKGETITLTTGNYVASEDIKIGKYDLSVKTGNGNLIITGTNGTLKVNEVFGLKTNDTYDFYTDSYSNLKLEKGDKIEITGGLSVLFSSK